MMILRKRQQGMYIRDIAAQMGCSQRTVRRILRRGGPASGRRPRARGSKLDPYKPTIDRLLDDGIWNCQVILTEIRQAGYPRGRSILEDYVRPKRSLQPARATVRYETPPGGQLQHDWGELEVELAGVRQRVYIAVNTLGYSRRFHVFAAPAADAEHTYESLVRAFEHFGGVAREVLVDNQKAAVVGRHHGRVTFQPRFTDLAGAYGFTPRACRPYRARTKGKTERMVGYVKDHFFARYRAFESFDHLNRCLEAWLAEVADQRVHGTHGEVVLERFRRDEADALQPLPRLRFDTAYRFQRVVGWDGYIDVAGNRYSVPDAYCGQAVTCRQRLDGELIVYGGGGEAPVIARHVLTDARAGWQQQPDHHARLWREAMAVEVRDLRVRGGGVMQLEQLFERLKFAYLPEQLDAVCEQAAKDKLDYPDFLARALETEWAGRNRQGIESRMKQARFPGIKTLEAFDFDFQPSIDRQVVRNLAGLAFVERAENVVLLGPPGVGKTHLAVALGVKAVEGGHRVQFQTLDQLMSRLKKARGENRLERTLQQLSYPKVLIIDEIGYLPLSRDEASLFFRLVTRRYERASLILTSNKSFADWGEVFGEQVIATAILDRLLHHATTINIKGESYRLKEKRRAGLLKTEPPVGSETPEAEAQIASSDALQEDEANTA